MLLIVAVSMSLRIGIRVVRKPGRRMTPLTELVAAQTTSCGSRAPAVISPWPEAELPSPG